VPNGRGTTTLIRMSDAETPIDTPRFQRWEPGLETIPAGEEALIDKMISDLRANNEFQFAKSVKKRRPHAIRDAHAKSCGILRGELTVRPDIPEQYRQGMFAEPGRTYPVIARISTTSGAIRSDQVRGVRGLGLKILDVCDPGAARASDKFDDTNQDFVFVTEPVFLFRDAEHYAGAGMTIAKVLSRMPDQVMVAMNGLLRGVRRLLGPTGRELPRNLRVFADPNHHVLGQTFYTAAPNRFGTYVAKLKVAPASKSVTDLTAVTIAPRDGQALTNAVREHFRSNGADYVVSAQLCTNTADMPVEDATVEWSEAESPYVPVATIHYPPQTAHSPALQRFGDDQLTFNSWRGIEEHRPLGGINRLKLRVYEQSSIFRHEANNEDYVEPKDLSGWPE
jgi:Catalase